MALDTRDKRASAVLGRTLPGPDGTIDAADRLHVAGLYRGVAAGEPAEPGRTVFGVTAAPSGFRGITSTPARFGAVTSTPR